MKATIPTQEQEALAHAQDEARKARAALAKMEATSAAVREAGGKMPAEWWAHFGDVFASVQVAERAVCRAREKVR